MISQLFKFVSRFFKTKKQDKSAYALDRLMRIEGGYSNHPNDPGGATNYGISLRYLKNAGIDLDDDGDIDDDDIQFLDEKTARRIFKKRFWRKYGYHKIKDKEIAAKVLDMSVHMGPRKAHELLQQSANHVINLMIMNRIAAMQHLNVDGLFGPETLKTINHIISHNKHDVLRNELKDAMRQYYVNLVEQQPRLRMFLKGWLKRAQL